VWVLADLPNFFGLLRVLFEVIFEELAAGDFTSAPSM